MTRLVTTMLATILFATPAATASATTSTSTDHLSRSGQLTGELRVVHPDRAVGVEVVPMTKQPAWLVRAFTCIHRYEGAWNAATGNGYYGGLQMDQTFMLTYGRDYVRRWGWAHNWPPAAQVEVAIKAYRSGRGFYPWPNAARLCGLI